ncbi:unnamed protein product [Dracunculus medinensis]|uniref:NUC153 domain-containing protein n=1 Tax=Dracunculus medinensis TaxID=318479 RepID=A0A0N4U4V7_DRAME|nr:unnamed protein product [Dracunculus medinensis]
MERGIASIAASNGLLEQLDSERHNLSLLKNSNEWEPPKINKELAAKLHAEIIVEDKKFNRKIRRKKENASSLLEDERFKQMFSNPDFQIDETSEQFQLINPALKKLEAKRNKSKFKLRENEILKDKTDDIPGSNLLSNEEIHASCSSSESDLDEKDNGNNESNENHLEDFVIPIETQTEGDHVEESQGKTKIRKKPRGFKLFELETGEDASQFLLSTASGVRSFLIHV